MKLKTLWVLLLALLMSVSAAAETIEEYDDEGRLTAKVLSNGVREEYDENDRPVLTVFPDGTFTRNEYDDAGYLIRASYSDGSYTEFEYKDGRMHRFIYPDGHLEEYEYGENGLPCRIFDENGDTIAEYEYYENGNLRREIRHDPNSFAVYEYDEEGNILTPFREYTDKETIRMAQEALNAAGYDCGAPDGVLGSGTAAVITQYQTDKNLTVTGTVTHEMLIELGVIEP